MKKFFIIILTLIMLYPSMNVRAVDDNKLAPKAKSSILIEATSGVVLQEKNADEKLYPASMTKVMTLILIFEHLNAKLITEDDIVTVSEVAKSMGGSQIYLETGEQMKVSDLLKSICIVSANDAAVAMAEYIGVTVERFVDMMNDKAKELGLQNTNFVNATGLHDKDHYTSARDMALMSKYLLSIGGEKLLQYTSTFESYIREDTDKKFWLVNTNKLLKSYLGVDGLKTGYTSQAGYCITATASRNGLRFIAVTMGEESAAIRNKETSDLLNYGFGLYESKLLFSKGSLVGTMTLKNTKKKEVNLVAKEDIFYIVQKNSTVEPQTKIENIIEKAPILVEDTAARLIITTQEGLTFEGDLAVEEEVSPYSYFDMLTNTFSKLFN